MIITFIIKYWNFKCRKSAITSHTDKYIYRYKQVFILKYLWRGKKQRRLRKKRRFQTGLYLNWSGCGEFIPLVDVRTPYLCAYLICLSDQCMAAFEKTSIRTQLTILITLLILGNTCPALRINNNLFGNLEGWSTLKWNTKSQNCWKRDRHRYVAGIMQEHREKFQ